MCGHQSYRYWTLEMSRSSRMTSTDKCGAGWSWDFPYSIGQIQTDEMLIRLVPFANYGFWRWLDDRDDHLVGAEFDQLRFSIRVNISKGDKGADSYPRIEPYLFSRGLSFIAAIPASATAIKSLTDSFI
jgi:hypothetical protein